MSLLATIGKLALELGIDLAQEWIRDRRSARSEAPPGVPIPHAESERIAAIQRAAGRCPRCQTVHPSDRSCPAPQADPQAPWSPRETLRPPRP